MTTIRTFARTFVPRDLRNWLRTPAKSAHYLADRTAFAWGSVSTVHITGEWAVKCHPASRPHFDIFRSDPGQSEELAAFFAFAHPGMRLLDIGAHHGFFAFAALHAGGRTAEVICVEPSSKALEILRANLHANEATSRVRIVNAAVGASDGQLQMLTTGPAGSDYFVVPSGPRGDTVPVPVRSMQSVLNETAFQPTHVKLDIEGYEFEVVEASIDLLATLKPVLYLELHGSFMRARGNDPAAVIANLRKAGYRSFISGQTPLDDKLLTQLHFNCRLVCTPQEESDLG